MSFFSDVPAPRALWDTVRERNAVWRQNAMNALRKGGYSMNGSVQPVAPPNGYLDRCVWKENNVLFMSGWALDPNPGHRISRIEIFLNGKLIATPSISLERPDIVKHFRQYAGERASEFLVSGWSTEAEFEEPLRPYGDVLLAKATSTSGLGVVLRRETLNNILSFDL